MRQTILFVGLSFLTVACDLKQDLGGQGSEEQQVIEVAPRVGENTGYIVKDGRIVNGFERVAYNYVGTCPGYEDDGYWEQYRFGFKTADGHNVLGEEGLWVLLKNPATGGFAVRRFFEGRYTEPTDLDTGSGHSNRYFIMSLGENIVYYWMFKDVNGAVDYVRDHGDLPRNISSTFSGTLQFEVTSQEITRERGYAQRWQQHYCQSEYGTHFEKVYSIFECDDRIGRIDSLAVCPNQNTWEADVLARLNTTPQMRLAYLYRIAGGLPDVHINNTNIHNIIYHYDIDVTNIDLNLMR